MNSQNNVTNLKIFGIKAIHFAACTVLFFLFWILFRYNEYTRSGTGYRYNYYMTIAYALLLLVFSRVYNAYLLGYSRIRELVFSLFLSQLFSAGIVWLGVSVAWKHFNMQSAIHVQSLDSPVMYVNRKSLTPEYMLVKRVSDIAVSGLALVMLSPVIGITALAVRMYDHGPVLYQQVRLTKDGWKFRILNVFRELFQFAPCNKPTNIAV